MTVRTIGNDTPAPPGQEKDEEEEGYEGDEFDEVGEVNVEEEMEEEDDEETDDEENGVGEDEEREAGQGTAKGGRVTFGVRLRAALGERKWQCVIISVLAWSTFLLFKSYLFTQDLLLGTDPTDNMIMSRNIEMAGSLTNYHVDYPFGYRLLSVGFKLLGGTDYILGFKLQMLIFNIFLYLAAGVIGVALFRNIVHANLFAMFMLLNPDVIRFLDWGGMAMTIGTGFFILASVLVLSDRFRGSVGRVSTVLFLFALTMTMSHVTGAGYLLALMAIIVIMAIVMRSDYKGTALKCGAIMGGIVIGSFYATEKMKMSLDMLGSLVTDFKVLVIGAIILVIMAGLFMASRTRGIKLPGQVRRYWPIILISMMVLLYIFDIFIISPSNNLVRTVRDFMNPVHIWSEFGLFPILSILGLIFVLKERMAKGPRPMRPLLKDNEFMFFFLLTVSCFGYVLGGLAIFQVTHIEIPYLNATRWVILANVPLLIFLMIGLRASFGHPKKDVLRGFAAAVVAGTFVFAFLANTHSIDYANHQSDATLGATLYVVDSSSINYTDFVTTQEGLWVPMLEGSTYMDNYTAFPTTDEVQRLEGIPPVTGIYFLSKGRIGDMPELGKDVQRIYIYERTGEKVPKHQLYFHKTFENSDVRIFTVV